MTPTDSNPLTGASPADGRRRPSRGQTRIEQAETRDAVLAAIAALPPRQREIITLRDIEGLTSDEACNALEVEETNQRVLLHRARSKARNPLERHFDEAESR